MTRGHPVLCRVFRGNDKAPRGGSKREREGLVAAEAGNACRDSTNKAL